MLPTARTHAPAFTARDRDLLHLLARGHTPAEIRDKLGLNGDEMREMLDALQERMGARNRAGLRLRLILRGGR